MAFIFDYVCNMYGSTVQAVLHEIALSVKITCMYCLMVSQHLNRERSGSVVECLTRDRRAAGSSLTGVTVLCP